MPEPKELLNRGNNLFAVALVAAIALGGASEIFFEGNVRGGLDEVAILLVAAGGVLWYRRNRYHQSLIPAAILGGPFIFKVIAILIEDADDKGDDYGAVATLLIALIIWAVIYYRSRSAAEPLADRNRPTLEESPTAVR